MRIGYNHDIYYKIPNPDTTDRKCPYCLSVWNYTLNRTVDARQQNKIIIKCNKCKKSFWIDSYSNSLALERGNDMKNKPISFNDKLREHNLTINEFLDLRDEWDTLSSFDKKVMLETELKRENPKVERIL